MVLVLAPGWAWAAEGVSEASGVSAGTVLQTVLGLLTILALLFLAAYWLRRLNGSQGLGGGGSLKIIGGLMMGTRERIVLVEVGDTWLVLGVAPGSVTALHQLPRRDVPAAGPTDAGGKDFSGWLKQVMERRSAH